jgi:hypothetical protein
MGKEVTLTTMMVSHGERSYAYHHDGLTWGKKLRFAFNDIVSRTCGAAGGHIWKSKVTSKSANFLEYLHSKKSALHNLGGALVAPAQFPFVGRY